MLPLNTGSKIGTEGCINLGNGLTLNKSIKTLRFKSMVYVNTHTVKINTIYLT